LKSTLHASPNQALAQPGFGPGMQAYAAVLHGAGGEQLKALTRLGDERAVSTALYAAPPYDLRVPALPVARMSLNLSGARVQGGVVGERLRSYDAHRYSLFVAPAGAEMTWCKEAPSRHLTIYFRPDLFEGEQASNAPLTQPHAHNNLNVPGLRTLADQLVLELRHGGPCDTDAADCIARLMLIQVSRHLSKARDSAKALNPLAQARLHDYVMAHLSERILVADLAAQLGLSINRFAWECKAATGQSPHQFVLALRLRHAVHLLHSSKLVVADVATACGFSSQQHLTNAMQRHGGVTPGRYRKAIRAHPTEGPG
jgi:AraC family transcriptional regulator